MNINSTGTKAYVENNSTTAAPSLQSIYNPPRYYGGEVGWICPICGRGNAPSTAYCNCNMTRSDIVYANGELTIKSTLPDTVPCQNPYITTSVSSNSPYTTATNTSK